MQCLCSAVLNRAVELSAILAQCSGGTEGTLMCCTAEGSQIPSSTAVLHSAMKYSSVVVSCSNVQCSVMESSGGALR